MTSETRWPLVNFGEVVEICRGISYSSSELTNEGYGRPLLNLRNVDKGGGFRLDGLKYFSGEFKERHRVLPGDLLIANTDLSKAKDVLGSPILVPTGFGYNDAVFSLDLTKLIVDPKVALHTYVAYFLESPEARLFMKANGSGTTVMHLQLKALPKLMIPLPPLAEQEKIVELLEDHLLRLDAALNNLKNAEDQSATLVASVFHQMITSRTQSLSSSKFSNQITLQRGFDLPKQNRFVGEVPIIASNGEVGRHNVSKVQAPGVVTGRSGTIGRVHYVTDGFWPLNTTLYVKDFHGNDPEFIRYYLLNMHLEKYAGGSTVPSLDRNVLSDVDVYFPELEEQKMVVRKIKEVEIQVAGIVRHCQSAVASNRTLRRSLLHSAFTGQLTKEVASV